MLPSSRMTPRIWYAEKAVVIANATRRTHARARILRRSGMVSVFYSGRPADVKDSAGRDGRHQVTPDAGPNCVMLWRLVRPPVHWEPPPTQTSPLVLASAS